MPITNGTAPPTTAEFLKDYPEFDTSARTDPDAVQFSASALTYWLTVAGYVLNTTLWGNLLYLATELFMAHNLALEAWSAQGGQSTVPGIAKGPIAASGAADVSVSYAPQATVELDAGHWNYTVFGQRFVKLARQIGCGPLYIGAGSDPTGGLNGPGWPGPFDWQEPNPSQ